MPIPVIRVIEMSKNGERHVLVKVKGEHLDTIKKISADTQICSIDYVVSRSDNVNSEDCLVFQVGWNKLTFSL